MPKCYAQAEGEIHGIGFDVDDSISQGRTFELWGTQTWGLQDYRNHDPVLGVVHYTIPVGQFYTGPVDRLFFVNDKDAAGPSGESIFSNVVISESG